MSNKTLYLAGGCFWGLEELIREQPGVVDTEVGYAGGNNDNPTYDNHPGHAESLEITFDTTVTSTEKLLDYFFRIHDPTTHNRQGNDVGSSYRSTLFTSDNLTEDEAKQAIERASHNGLWNNPIVTSVEPLTTFWPAEEYHQDYLRKNPGGYTCHFER